MPFTMTPATRRTTLVRLLADIDQRIELAKDLSDNPMLSWGERRCAEDEFKTHHDTAKLIEKMLARLASESVH
jgi:hypothetical protein